MIPTWTVDLVLLPSIVGGMILIPELVLLLTRHSRRCSATTADRCSLLSLWGVILVSIVAAMPFAYYQQPAQWGFELEEEVLVLAVGLLLAGMVLRWWSIRTLGQFFTVNVAIHQQHRLVAQGPYAVIRHPSYSGLLLEFLALALTFEHIISLGVIMVPTLIAFIVRIHIEERALAARLGDEYRSYQDNTYVLIPYVY